MTEWISVKDNVPSQSTRYDPQFAYSEGFLIVFETECGTVKTAVYNKEVEDPEVGEWEDPDGRPTQVTHWMLLPKPPKDKD